MSWDWLWSKPGVGTGAAGVRECAAALQQLTADRWSFFAQTRAAVRAAAGDPECRAELRRSVESWRQRIVSKVATAFPDHEPEFHAANEALAPQLRASPAGVAETLAWLVQAPAPLARARTPELCAAGDVLRRAANEFTQLCAGTLVTADELLGGQPAPVSEAGGYSVRGTAAAQAIARECLLRDGFAVRFPIAVVPRDQAAPGRVLEFAVEVFDRSAASRVAPHPAELSADHEDFRLAAAQAWSAAVPHDAPARFAVWRVLPSAAGRDFPLAGRSAGGAFALAFRRAVQRRDYPAGVIVLAAVNAAGRLVALGDPADRELACSLERKVAAIRESGRLDTIATVEAHFDFIETLLRGQDRVRVRLIEARPGLETVGE